MFKSFKIERDDLIACGVYFLVTLVFFFRFLDGTEVFAFKDLSRYFYPLRHLMVDQVKMGILPLWNPYVYCGMPLMAGLQVGLFYPLTFIYYLLPFDLAFNYYIVIHYFLAAVFVYAFLRYLKASPIAAFFSGLVFAFSGYLLSVSNMNTSLSSVIWLPLALIAFDRFVRSFSPRAFIIFILSLTVMLLGGEPTIIYTTAILLFFWALVFAEGRRRKLLTAGAIALALLVVLLLTALQLIPFMELSLLSDRMTITQFEQVTVRSLPIR